MSFTLSHAVWGSSCCQKCRAWLPGDEEETPVRPALGWGAELKRLTWSQGEFYSLAQEAKGHLPVRKTRATASTTAFILKGVGDLRKKNGWAEGVQRTTVM